MSLYDVDIDLTKVNTSHVQVIELVGSSDRVLDVGCWTGDLGRVLREQGAHVTGFELDPEAAATAGRHLDAVVVGDLDRSRLTDHFGDARFDAIIFADVLEHVYDPAGVLADATELLAPGGRIVISVPNVTHGSLRLAHLQGRWTTTDTGLLDHTHIRFFTRERLIALVEGAGLVVDDLRATVLDPFGCEVEIDPAALPAGVIAWVREQPDAYVYQFQLAARPLRPGEEPGTPQLRTAIEPREARPAAERRLQLVHAWRRELVERDRILGLEAASEAAVVQARHDAKRIAKLRAELEAATMGPTPASPPARGTTGLRPRVRRVLSRARRAVRRR